MVNEFAYDGDGDPREVLSRARELIRRVRAAQRATWIPLLVFAAVTFAAIPAERYGGRHVGPCATIFTQHGTGLPCVAYSTGAFVYWPIALVLAYVAIAAFYQRRSQTRGLGHARAPVHRCGKHSRRSGDHCSPVGGTPCSARRARRSGPARPGRANPDRPAGQSGLRHRARAAGPGVGRAQYRPARLHPGLPRDRARPGPFGWVVTPPWTYIPHLVIPGGVLLLGAAGFDLAQPQARLSGA
jgi:hypothetical protein